MLKAQKIKFRSTNIC